MINVLTPVDYIKQFQGERREAVIKLRETIFRHLPEEFKKPIGEGMIAYVAPHLIYQERYNCNKEEPLPFISIASQKFKPYFRLYNY
ncbi:hypothetical protein [Haloplasma contractile]|uniref:Uncharacterized protein n=1 Tax=Haloplasma contractile SSD-17B TaxID=1033810 RepID=F7PTR0_9MOLU|nr:hypothetical protein [Haloplasma contractile]ERJ12223.1 hypothetical protein HLPCO_001750 [Haloplasma contractile SSD-17B]